MDWACHICNINAHSSIIAMTETLILLFMVQNNSSTNATDSVFANNNVSESGGAIYTDVRARFQYKAFDAILCSCLFKGMHAFMEI